MTKHKAGLHKDVSTIFDGVWNPEIDNNQPSFSAPVDTGPVYIQPAPVAVEHWPKEPKSATILKVFKGASGGLFRSRARREKKRLMSISRHLIINQSS